MKMDRLTSKGYAYLLSMLTLFIEFRKIMLYSNLRFTLGKKCLDERKYGPLTFHSFFERWGITKMAFPDVFVLYMSYICYITLGLYTKQSCI